MSPIAIQSVAVESETPLASKTSVAGASTINSTLQRPNTALYVTKDHQIYQKDEPFPSCPPGHCVVHVKATGICGTEIHYWKHGGIGPSCIENDTIMGHESAGQVVQVGEGVTSFKVGDRVSIEPGVSCWNCDECLDGRYNICQNVIFSGSPDCHGTMRRFVAHPARYLHPIPDDMSYRLGALVEPLSVAYNAISRGKPYLGQPVLVAGAGPIGLATAICARAAGCHPICITDLDESRLAQAQALGFDKTVAVEMSWTREQVADKVREVMGKGCAPSLGFECTGAESSLNAAFYSLRPGGTIVQVGCGRAEVSVPLMQMVFTEADLRTTFRYRQSWPTVIRMAAAGMFGDCEKMITHTYPVEKSVDAFEACIDKSKMAIKVQIVDE